MRNLTAIALGIALLASGCATTPPPAAEVAAADYGQEPVAYENAIHQYFDSTLKDPSSVQYRNGTPPEKGYMKAGILLGGKTEYGWLVRVEVNAKNSYGGYVGYKLYTFLFRGNVIVDEILPPTE